MIYPFNLSKSMLPKEKLSDIIMFKSVFDGYYEHQNALRGFWKTQKAGAVVERRK